MSELAQIIPAWQAFSTATKVIPIRDEAHYHYMVDTLEELLAQTGADENHPLMDLVDIVGDLIADYEASQKALPEATGIEALKFLMQQHEVKQNQLPEVGSQGVVSEVLNGKRSLNVRQIRALAERFGVSPVTFI